MEGLNAGDLSGVGTCSTIDLDVLGDVSPGLLVVSGLSVPRWSLTVARESLCEMCTVGDRLSGVLDIQGVATSLSDSSSVIWISGNVWGGRGSWPAWAGGRGAEDDTVGTAESAGDVELQEAGGTTIVGEGSGLW